MKWLTRWRHHKAVADIDWRAEVNEIAPLPFVWTDAIVASTTTATLAVHLDYGWTKL